MNDDLMSAIRWNEDGLVPAIAQDAASGQVLMLAWMNREALAATVAAGAPFIPCPGARGEGAPYCGVPRESVRK